MRIGVIAEGATDPPVVKKLINKVIVEFLGLDWPAHFEDLKEFPIRKTGFGGVVAKLKALIYFLNEACDPSEPPIDEPYYQDLYCVFIDNGCGRKANNEAILEISELIRRNPCICFVLGIPKEELEAWIIADSSNVLPYLGYREYVSFEITRPEDEVDPKKILASWIREAREYVYNDWDSNSAEDIVDVLDVRVIDNKCIISFRPWKNELVKVILRKAGRLV